MKWSRPEISNSVRELTKFGGRCTAAHMKAMYRCMSYLVGTPDRGKLLKPNRKCTDPNNFELVISGRSDSDYAKDTEKRRSVSGFAVYLEGAPISHKSRMQQSTTLSVSEAELVAATECAQDMMFVKHVLESIGLKVKLPMMLEIDNKGAIDLCNNYSVGGRTRHIDTKYWWLRQLKEQEPTPIILPVYIPTEENSVDIFTKNTGGATFMKHTMEFVGKDAYN